MWDYNVIRRVLFFTVIGMMPASAGTGTSSYADSKLDVACYEAKARTQSAIAADQLLNNVGQEVRISVGECRCRTVQAVFGLNYQCEVDWAVTPKNS